MDRTFALAGAISGFVAVLAGAFGAHTLRERLTPDMVAIFETGARYQMYHALGLLAVALTSTHWPGTPVRAAGWLFIGGTVLFSGSLYLLSVTGTRWLGAITPFGGLMFLTGWAALAIAIARGVRA